MVVLLTCYVNAFQDHNTFKQTSEERLTNVDQVLFSKLLSKTAIRHLYRLYTL